MSRVPDDHLSGHCVAAGLKQSTRTLGGPPHNVFCLILHRMGFTEPGMSPCPLVVSYSTLSPLPFCKGGLLSVALACGLLRVGVTHHHALWCPDFPRHDVATIRNSIPKVSLYRRLSNERNSSNYTQTHVDFAAPF